ncbi:hypothetical protein PDJAM_G00215640 [Pangasius djambal]|uniref:Uncharacterized protein n=1 Tax=Pangasius djambal TaxID=1691987 RepID=A0ACC5YAU3_9TELE|nr:hypothetical protein [Pangasius djambal]
MQLVLNKPKNYCCNHKDFPVLIPRLIHHMLILNILSGHLVLFDFMVKSCRRLMIYNLTILSLRRGSVPFVVWFLSRFLPYVISGSFSLPLAL